MNELSQVKNYINITTEAADQFELWQAKRSYIVTKIFRKKWFELIIKEKEL